MEHTTWVDLIRHGEPVGGPRIRGQSDDPLTELGWQQMWQAVGEDAAWQVIVSSPLTRCTAFARALADKHGLPLHVEPRFKEIAFGSWEGRGHDDLARREPERYPRFRDDPLRYMPPDAEPVPAFMARVAEAWGELLAAHAGCRVLVVCHAGVIRAVLAAVLGAGPEHLFRAQVDYASLTRFAAAPHRPPSLISHAAPLT